MERAEIASASEVWGNAAAHARAAGDRGGEAGDLAGLVIDRDFDATPAAEGLERANGTLVQMEDVPAAKAEMLWEVSTLHAMLGHLGLNAARSALPAARSPIRMLSDPVLDGGAFPDTTGDQLHLGKGEVFVFTRQLVHSLPA